MAFLVKMTAVSKTYKDRPNKRIQPDHKIRYALCVAADAGRQAATAFDNSS